MPFMPATRRITRLLTLITLSLLPACSAFDTTWNDTAPPTMANPAAPLAGKWEGTWQSDATAYEGILQAIIAVPKTTTISADGKPTQEYRIQIKQYLFDVITNEYTVMVTANPGPDGKTHFSGERDRGSYYGGIYHFDGYVKDRTFFCDYTSGKDCGTFLMRRLLTEPE